MSSRERPDLTGFGTPEEDWQSWPGLAALPILPEDPEPADVVVLAPHPDDEVLGAGGALALLARAGARVTVVAVTDGEGSHPDSPSTSPAALVARRLDERTEAIRTLGLSDVDVLRLRLPDGRVAEHEDELYRRVLRRLRADSLCLAPWTHDGHPDHDATGRAAAAASARAGARLRGYLIWLWHWARPGAAGVPWSRLRRLPLPDEVASAKRRAATAFASQIHPLSAHPADAAVLPDPVLRRLLRDEEVYVL